MISWWQYVYQARISRGSPSSLTKVINVLEYRPDLEYKSGCVSIVLIVQPQIYKPGLRFPKLAQLVSQLSKRLCTVCWAKYTVTYCLPSVMFAVVSVIRIHYTSCTSKASNRSQALIKPRVGLDCTNRSQGNRSESLFIRTSIGSTVLPMVNYT